MSATHAARQVGVGGVDAIEPQLLLEPLEYLFADHFRHRVLCNRLDVLVDDPPIDRHTAEFGEILNFLTNDLPLHIADEEESLFPLLSTRCLAGDGYNEIYVLLQEEHELDEQLSETVIDGLRGLTKDGKAADPDGFFRTVGVFTETQRRHLAWENGIVLPLARKRLTRADLAQMGQAMAARRGLDYPPPPAG